MYENMQPGVEFACNARGCLGGVLLTRPFWGHQGGDLPGPAWPPSKAQACAPVGSGHQGSPERVWGSPRAPRNPIPGGAPHPEHQPWQPWHPGQRRTGLCAPSPRAGWSARPAASRPGWAARCRRRKPSARPPWPGTRRSTVQGAPCTEHWTLSTAEPRTAVTAAAAGVNAGNTAQAPPLPPDVWNT